MGAGWGDIGGASPFSGGGIGGGMGGGMGQFGGMGGFGGLEGLAGNALPAILQNAGIPNVGIPNCGMGPPGGIPGMTPPYFPQQRDTSLPNNHNPTGWADQAAMRLIGD